MKKDVKEKRHLPAPLRDAGVVTYIQPHLIPHLILRGGIGLVALARRTFPRRYQPQLLVPTRWFHEVSGARRRSVPKLRKLSVGLSANQDPMRGSRPIAFFGYPRGHRIDPETRCWTTAHKCLNECLDTLPRTGASQEPIGYHRGMKTLGDHLGSIRCSSCLRLQLFDVETFLLLPKCQGNGRDLARQRQPRHLRLHPLGQQRRVEIMERSPATAGPGSRTLEDLFHLMIVISIQPTNLLGFLGALQLSAHKAVLRTVVGLNAQPTVGPELPLAAKPVRGLHQPDP